MAVLLAVLTMLAFCALVLVVPRVQDRRRLARIDAVSMRLLADAAAELGLGEPRLVDKPLARWACAGTMLGVDAELGLSGKRAQLRRSLGCDGLPSGVSVTPGPTGRGMEDYYIGAAAVSGNPQFDAHFCIYGSKECSGEALANAAKIVPAAILGFAVDHFDPTYELMLSRTELHVRRGSEVTAPDDLVAMWRYVERLVADGLARGVLQK
jgi:hypothetical protein